jgi:hypothetical protein
MDRHAVQTWLDRYVAAWRANDHATIVDLFARDADYRWHPWDEPVRGNEAIAAAWLEEPDDPDRWDAWYEPVAVEGDVAVATGTSTYFDRDRKPERTYDNAFVLRFDDEGRCRSFTEFFMLRPDA